ncbi:MAG: hypothetical protein ASARMPREDX12_008563 [Alectoria sarmentosa]|nr:MAG: hypothetical protein ASARMPREDX12_008563 [Alectoria sarmentosa]
MSIPRLTFLYPHLFNPARVQKTALALKPLHASQPPFQKAGISTTRPNNQETYAQRYGTAAEPQPPLSMPSKPQEGGSLAGAIEREVKSDTKPEQKELEAPPPKEPEKKAASDTKDKDKPDSSRDAAITATMRDPSTRATELDASESHPKQPSPESLSDNKARTAKPLETVLQMGPPEAEKQEEHKAPHLQAPPYLHHFDTFTLVRDLERGGFSEEQSVTIMKAVRGQLAVNLDVAKEGLVSKSDVENENYLFRAACSELRTEILNARKSSSTHTRTQLSHLQHTYDILSQRVSQETLSLKDDLRGMLNDRRMAVRMQSQTRDGEISELNYKISVVLGSEQKSEVEGLRWVLTRRAAMAIGMMAVLILGTLRYGSYKMHEREIEEKKKGPGLQSSGTGTSGASGGVGFTVSSREMGTQTEEKGGMGDKSENVGYVSLG